ncbi:hypothetical protein [Microtetraspora niveoalba]|uniref:hypothetical protein n=1 Tax=Microtetraspora niveoalba TaxID=46175 RepID=UPI000A00A782|nr:hypothetical protein [Microtetraspora niveoalba]
MSHQKPSVGRIVHYVSYGTPGGEYKSECRAAIVTEVLADGSQGAENNVGLAVLNPEGVYFNRAVPQDEGAETPGSPDCPNKAGHGSPFRYCGCGWMEAGHCGGTWHWPERV